MASNDCRWEAIHGFVSIREFKQFCLWLMSLLNDDLVVSHNNSKPVEAGGIFICRASSAKWQLVPPAGHLYGFWGPVDESYFPWPDNLSIQSPGQFEKFLEDLKYWLDRGLIKQIQYGAQDTLSVSIVDIPESGPWPDYLDAYFETETRILYQLSVDLYHGSGGHWKQI